MRRLYHIILPCPAENFLLYSRQCYHSRDGINFRREEVNIMLSIVTMLAVGVVSTAVGTVIGTVVGVYICNRWLKK